MKTKFKDLKPGDRFRVPYNDYWFVKVNESNVFSNELTEIDVENSFNTHVIKRVVLDRETVIKKQFFGLPSIFEVSVDPNFEVEKTQYNFTKEVLDCILKSATVIDLI